MAEEPAVPTLDWWRDHLTTETGRLTLTACPLCDMDLSHGYCWGCASHWHREPAP